MSAVDALLHRLRVLLRGREYDREIAEEQAFHLEMQAAHFEQESHGAVGPDAARYAARRRYGNTTIYREAVRDMSGLGLLETAVQDLRFALRSFRRTPAFTTVVIATLAIGIGANTAIFSAMHALLLRPLPFSEPDRLMALSITRPADGDYPANDNAPWSHPKFVVLRETQQVYASIGFHAVQDATVRFGEDAERLREEVSDAAYFETLRVAPTLGRYFSPAEDAVANGPAVAILSHAFWTRRFGANASAIGGTVRINGTTHQIIGVMPEGFHGLSGQAELWRPALLAEPTAIEQAFSHQYSVVARLRDGVGVAQAQAEAARVADVIGRTYADPGFGDRQDGVIARELDATRIDPLVRRSLYVLFGAVTLVLLIACANVANLFLVRASARAHELAVRLAIGATRRRLIRQLVTESMLLSVFGGLAGVLVAYAAVVVLSSLDAARALNVRSLGGIGAVNMGTIELDLLALSVSAGLAVTCGLIFGVVPAIQATRMPLEEQLRHGRQLGARWSWRSLSGRNLLVATEVALAVVLLAGAGLMVQSLRGLMAVSPGFDATQLLTFRLGAPDGAPRDSTPDFYRNVMARLAKIPSVTGVTAQDCPPLNGGCNGTVMWRLDRARDPNGDPTVGAHWIGDDWQTVMGVRIVQGRGFESSERAAGTKAVLVSESAAQRVWPGESPLGKQVGVGQGGFHEDPVTVVGVVQDIRYGTIDALPKPDVYLPLSQSPRSRMMLMVRTSSSVDAITPAVRTALREVAPGLPVYDLRSMESRVADSTAYARFTTLLLTLFAAVALALAAIGAYGVIAYSVSQRTREIGVRMALGAHANDVVRLITGQGVMLGVIGAVCGTAIALASTRVLRAMLYEVSPTDIGTFAAIIVLLLISVAIASWIPARRAAGIQPTEALRGE